MSKCLGKIAHLNIHSSLDVEENSSDVSCLKHFCLKNYVIQRKLVYTYLFKV